MKIDLSIPSLNVICDALKALQQQCAVASEAIVSQVQAQQAAETAGAKKKGRQRK